MAIDKVIDSAQLDGALKASADAIRAKTGDVEPIPFDMATATGFAAAIAAISAGDASGISVESGTYIPSANTNKLNVDISQAAYDGCLFMICKTDDDLSGFVTTDYALQCVYAAADEGAYVGDASNAKRYATLRVLHPNVIAANSGINNFMIGLSLTENKVEFGVGAAISSFKAGIEYTWSVYYAKGENA